MVSSNDELGDAWGLGSVFQKECSVFIPVLFPCQSIHHSATECASAQKLSLTVANEPINLICHNLKAKQKIWDWICHQSKSAQLENMLCTVLIIIRWGYDQTSADLTTEALLCNSYRFVCADSLGALVIVRIKTGMMPSFLLPVKVNLLLVCLFSTE